jgi:two-component system OmpR family response regulator/two-component system response regulator CpxR
MRLRRPRPILVIDDDEETREGLAEFLSALGYEAAVAHDGQHAMDLLVGGLQPSLLIVDIAMPHVAGDELLKYVQGDPELRLVPVVIVTGDPGHKHRAVADAVLPKPVDLNALLALVRRLIDERASAPTRSR